MGLLEAALLTMGFIVLLVLLIVDVLAGLSTKRSVQGLRGARDLIVQLNSQVNDTLYEDVFLALPVAAILLDESKNIIAINNQLAGLLGYNIENIKGHNIDILLPDSKRDGHNDKIDDFYQNNLRGMGKPRAVTARHSDGSDLELNLSIGTLAQFDYTGHKTVIGIGLVERIK